MRKIRTIGSVAIRPELVLTGAAGYYPHPAGPLGPYAVVDETQLNSMSDEILNAVEGVLGQGENTASDFQLLNCFEAYLPIAGGVIHGGIGLTISAANVSGHFLDVGGQVAIGDRLTLSGVSGTAAVGQGGAIALKGGSYGASSVPAGVGLGAIIDSVFVPGTGNQFRAYSGAYTSGNPIVTINTDTGLLTASDVFVGATSVLVSQTLSAIGNGGHLYVRQINNNRSIYFMNGDPGTTDGAATGSITQLSPTDPGSPNALLLSANGDTANSIVLTPAGIVDVPGPVYSTVLGEYLAPGYSNQYADGTPGTRTFIVPANIYRVRVAVTGCGGGGDGAYNTGDGSYVSGGGGGAGGTAIVDVAVVPGEVLTYTIGTPGQPGSFPGGNYVAPTAGGSVIVYGVASATGGYGAYYNGNGSNNGGQPGTGSGGFSFWGGFGTDGMAGSYIFTGNGGASFYGGGGRGATFGGLTAECYGAGGGGGYAITGDTAVGGPGANGLVYIQW